jgi:hypothetical protein
MRVFRLRIVAAKNSRNRFAACSPASAIIAGAITLAMTLAETRGATTVRSRVGSGRESGSASDMG